MSQIVTSRNDARGCSIAQTGLRTTLLGILLLAAGCGRMGFSKPGAAEFDFGRDYLVCATPAPPPPPAKAMECKGPACAQVQIDSSRNEEPDEVDDDIIHNCLRAKGWHLERGGTFRP